MLCLFANAFYSVCGSHAQRGGQAGLGLVVWPACLVHTCTSGVTVNTRNTAAAIAYKAYTFTNQRPFDLLWFNTSLPDLERLRRKKPCLRLRLTTLGWYSRLTAQRASSCMPGGGMSGVIVVMAGRVAPAKAAAGTALHGAQATPGEINSMYDGVCTEVAGAARRVRGQRAWPCSTYLPG